MRTGLAGAWSLDGAPIGARLTAADRAALAVDEAAPLERPRLWLSASAAVALSSDACAAFDGLMAVPDEKTAMTELLAAAPAFALPWEGHYTALRADFLKGTLTLWREPTGEARLYHAKRGGLLLFSTSLRRLLSCLPGRRLDAAALAQRLLSELLVLGDATLLEGVCELRAGHRLSAEGLGVRSDWAWGDLLERRVEDSPEESVRLREALSGAVARAVAGQRRVAVALSGGIDSSALAETAARLVGPENVRAFTCEFDDPEHPSEVPFADQVCRHLGIARPEVVSISREDYLAGVAPAVAAAEDPAYWRRPYAGSFARRIAQAGFDRFLTGYGFGSHLAYLGHVAWAARWAPLGAAALWRGRSTEDPVPDRFLARMRDESWLARWHPGLARPFPRLVLPLAAALSDRGNGWALPCAYPPALRGLVERALAASRAREELAELRDAPLDVQLRRLCIAHVNSSVDGTRHSVLSRAQGAAAVSPASFPSLLPWTHLPPVDAGARLRPGKSLLRRAMRGVLPDAIVDRVKYWPHPGGSARWRAAAMAALAAAGPLPEELRAPLGRDVDAGLRFFPDRLWPLAAWTRRFLC